MKRLRLVEFKLFDKVRVYSIHFENKAHNETDDFISRFDSNEKLRKDFQTIIQFIKSIGDNGALERYFRNESRAKALLVVSSKLRLYCIRLSDSILILGNGDRKTAKKVQNCPNCFPHFKNMNAIQRVVNKKIHERNIIIIKDKLEGELDFLI